MAADPPSALSITAKAMTDMTLLTVIGVLDSTTYLAVRDTIIKAALAEPAGVVVDMSDLDVPAASALAVFTSARWQVADWPQTPIALVCAGLAGRDALKRNGITRYVPVYACVADAVAVLAVGDGPSYRRRARVSLRADYDCLWRARRLVEARLAAWSLEELIPVTNVIVTVLLENVLQHTASAPNLRLESDGVTVTVAVEDDSHRLAELIEGPAGSYRLSGLSIVAALSRVWGNAPTSSGKTVWAVIGPENRL